MKYYYIIFDCLHHNVLHITSDYYHFRRLLKKYVKEHKEVIYKKISYVGLFNYSDYF